MRFHYYDTVRDQLGHVVANASVSIYQAGTETDLTVYSVNSGGTSLGTAPQITTDSDGKFEFWVSDGDYDHDQKIKIVVE